MRILATQYTLENKSLDIYVSGCNANPKCAGCHNPESWDFNCGELYNFEDIQNKVLMFDALIDNIMIMGGEPLDNSSGELINLLYDIDSLGKQVWLFTRYELDEVPEEVLYLCDYIKTGAYRKDLIVDDNIHYGIKLSTSNQRIFKIA